ncbi:uncharacterized protein LOC134463737 [Engraulis encrasicolus]|uniref:uncharacterized protein LOC134463737 n=1 Tax=Engraulis encrasicolus TaxID=184585 RepID=UPI002FD5BD4D
MNGSQIPNSTGKIPSHQATTVQYALQNGTVLQQTGVVQNSTGVQLVYAPAVPVYQLTGYCLQSQQAKVYVIQQPQAQPCVPALASGSPGQAGQQQQNNDSASHSFPVTQSRPEPPSDPEQAQVPANGPPSNVSATGQEQQGVGQLVQLEKDSIGGGSTSHSHYSKAGLENSLAPPGNRLSMLGSLPATLTSSTNSPILLAVSENGIFNNSTNLTVTQPALSVSVRRQSDTSIKLPSLSSVMMKKSSSAPPKANRNKMVTAMSSVPTVSQQSVPSEGMSVLAPEKHMDVSSHITRISRNDLINLSIANRAKNTAHAGMNSTPTKGQSHAAQRRTSCTQTQAQKAQEQKAQTQSHKAVAIVPPLSKECADGRDERQTSEPLKMQHIRGPSGEKTVEMFKAGDFSAINPPVYQQSVDDKCNVCVEDDPLVQQEQKKLPELSVEKTHGAKTLSGLMMSDTFFLQTPTTNLHEPKPSTKKTLSQKEFCGERAAKISLESSRLESRIMNHKSTHATGVDEHKVDSLPSTKGNEEKSTQSPTRPANAQPDETSLHLATLAEPVQSISPTPFKCSVGMLKELVADLEAKNTANEVMEQSTRSGSPNLVRSLLDIYWGGSARNYQAARAEGIHKILKNVSMFTGADDFVFDCMNTDISSQLEDNVCVLNGDRDVDTAEVTVESPPKDIGEEIKRLAENRSSSEALGPLLTECPETSSPLQTGCAEIMGPLPTDCSKTSMPPLTERPETPRPLPTTCFEPTSPVQTESPKTPRSLQTRCFEPITPVRTGCSETSLPSLTECPETPRPLQTRWFEPISPVQTEFSENPMPLRTERLKSPSPVDPVQTKGSVTPHPLLTEHLSTPSPLQTNCFEPGRPLLTEDMTGHEVNDTLSHSPRSPCISPVNITLVPAEDIEWLFNSGKDDQMALNKEPFSPPLSNEGQSDSVLKDIKVTVCSVDQVKSIFELFEDGLEPSSKSPDQSTMCTGEKTETSLCSNVAPCSSGSDKSFIENTKTVSDNKAAPCSTGVGKSTLLDIAPCPSNSSKSVDKNTKTKSVGHCVDRHLLSVLKKKTQKPLFKKALSSYIKENTRVPQNSRQSERPSIATVSPKQTKVKGQIVSPNDRKGSCATTGLDFQVKRKLCEHSDEVVHRTAESHSTGSQDDRTLNTDVKLKRHTSPVDTSHSSSTKRPCKEASSPSPVSKTPVKTVDSRDHLTTKAFLYSPAETSAKNKVKQNWATAFVPLVRYKKPS